MNFPKITNIPQQTLGSESNTCHEVAAQDNEEAHAIYTYSSERLLNVNHWHDFAGFGTASFQLTEDKGVVLSRQLMENDYIRIDIPGPGPTEGDGYDWVKVEKIDRQDDLETEVEWLSIRVRPSHNPEKPGGDVAHFFTSDASSNFIILREGLKVKACVIGKNELPNIKGTFIDKARFAVIGTSAGAGLSKIQWAALVKGLLKVEGSS